MLRHGHADTDLGRLTLVADGDAIVGLYFPDHKHAPKEIGEAAGAEDPIIARAAEQLLEYLAGARPEFDLDVATDGDDFSERVWALLKKIPHGETVTYGDLARALGNVNYAQRVGQCVGRNPISIIIPCHRVVGADGALTGYAGGVERKRTLLDLESSQRPLL